MSNPYEIDSRAITLRHLGATRGHDVFLVEVAGGGLSVCNARRELADFIMGEFEGAFHLGNDSSFSPNDGSELILAVGETIDVARLELAFTIV